MDAETHIKEINKCSDEIYGIYITKKLVRIGRTLIPKDILEQDGNTIASKHSNDVSLNDISIDLHVPPKALILNVLPSKELTPLELNIIPNDGSRKPLKNRKKKYLELYTAEIFIRRARDIYGETFDYSQITEQDVNNKHSIVKIICRACHYNFTTSVKDHITGKGTCRKCFLHARIDLELLLHQKYLHNEDSCNKDKLDGWCDNNILHHKQILYEHSKNIRYDVSLRCTNCGQNWIPTLYEYVTSTGGRCPDCSLKRPWTVSKFVKRSKQIYENLYDYSLITEAYFNTPSGTNNKVPIICNNCGLTKNITIISHIEHGVGCLNCYSGHGYSDAQIKWLNEIMYIEKINIQYALSSEGEYFIHGVGNVDGYCHETNTVYEFHGDFWHGNPGVFASEKVNPVVGKTYGFLYERTLRRDQLIRDLGYNLVVKWENSKSNRKSNSKN